MKHYGKIVSEKAVLRRLIKVAENIENDCYQEKEGLDSILEETEKNIFGLLQNRSNDDYVPIRKVVMNALDRIEAASKTQGNVTGIPTGFNSLDYKLSAYSHRIWFWWQRDHLWERRLLY